MSNIEELIESDSGSLPAYKSNAAPEQRVEKQKFMYWQLSMIKEQSGWGMTADNTEVRCGCNKKLKLIYAYRCLYCGIWYCEKCAEEHFGMRKAKQTKGGE